MKIKDAAKLLNCSRMTIHNYIKAGKIKVDKMLPNGYRELNEHSVYSLLGSFFRLHSSNSIVFIEKSDGKTFNYEISDEVALQIIDFLKIKK